MLSSWRPSCFAAACLLAACSKADGGPAGNSETTAERTLDAGTPDSGDAGGGRVCAEPSAASASDQSLALGPAFEIGTLQGIGVSVRDDEGSTGVDGTASLLQSRLGGDGPPTTPAELTTPGGKLCVSGNTVIVPLMSFEEYWGAGIELYLNTETLAGEPPSNAGVDAGSPLIEGYRTFAWDPAPGKVVGFSFVVHENDPELACGGLPPLFRVQTSAVGSNRQQSDIHCKDFSSLTDGQRLDVLFSEVTRECWDGPGGRALFDEPLPAGYLKQIYGLLFIVPADQVDAYAFDLCISDIRPIIEP